MSQKSYESLLNAHHFDENRLKIGQGIAELFLKLEPNFQHTGKCIAKHRMRFFSTSHPGCATSQRVSGPILRGVQPSQSVCSNIGQVLAHVRLFLSAVSEI